VISSALLAEAVQSPEWNADVYGAFSSVSRLAASIQKQANVIRVAYGVRKANKSLQSLFDKLEAIFNGEAPPTTAERPTPQRLRDAADELSRTSRTIATLHETLRRVGLTNNSLTAGALVKFHSYIEQLEDVADLMELAAEESKLPGIFERAARERDRGEIFDLEKV